MKKLIGFIFLASLTIQLKAQIIIVEARQLQNDAQGFESNINFNFNINSNVSTNLTGNLGSESHYMWRKHRVLSLNSYQANFNFGQEGNAVVNQGYQHFRYTYDLNQTVTAAAFTQIQTNPVLRIRMRYLIGGGPRFNLQPYGSNELMVGAMPMFEYEQEKDTSAVHKDFRMSFYVYYKFDLSNTVNAQAVSYYQPRIDLARDFRLSTTLNLNVKINEKLNWSLQGNLVYDAFPVVDPNIPNFTFSIMNGFNYKI